MRRTYRINPETQELEEITPPGEWINGGVRYGSETLAMMKKKNLVPPTDFTEHWEKKAKERAALYTDGGTPEMKAKRKQDIREAVEKARYQSPNRRPGGNTRNGWGSYEP
jgi:hypothetical protein